MNLAETHTKTIVHTRHGKAWAVSGNAGRLGSDGHRQSLSNRSLPQTI